MKLNLKSYITLGVGAAALLFFASLGANVAHTQNSNDDWKVRKESLVKWASSVKSIRCNFSLSKYTNGKYRVARKEQWKDALKQHPRRRTEPDDTNYSFLYFWAADENRWRCDKSRFYPRTGHDFSQYIHDGERYYFFDEYLDRAIISGQDKQQGFVKDIHSNIWLSLNVSRMLDSFDAAGLGNFKKTGDAVIVGRKSSIYAASNANGEVTLWVDDENTLLTRFKEVTRGSDSYSSTMIYEWKNARNINGVLLPSECKLETYDTEKGVVTWAQTVTFSLKDCEVNLPLTESTFKDALRVGTTLEDQIENPDRISYVGGDITDEAEKVRMGTPPQKPELTPGATNGAPK